MVSVSSGGVASRGPGADKTCEAKMKALRVALSAALATFALAFSVVPVAAAQDRLAPNEKINGYTNLPFDTTHNPYDILVDSALPQDDPANHAFKTLQAAYTAAPAGTAAKPTIIGIKPDVYLLTASPSAPSSLSITKNYITLLGLTDDRRKVVLADNRGNKEGATNNGYILDINADGFSMINLTVVNFCNLDYDYPGNPAKNLKMRSPVITQAVAVQTQGDKHYFSHVAILSRLDTMFIRTTRSYFTNVFVEGTDDFLGGGQVAVFQDSEIYFPSCNGVMSASGITFINTTFKAAKGLEFYKGFRNPDTLIDCTMPLSTAQAPVAWMVWKAAVRQNVYSLTYHVKDAAGHPLRIRDSIVGPATYALSRELTDEQAKAFNPWNLLRAAPNGPADDWDPANARAKFESHGSDVFRMAVTGKTAAASDADLGAGPFTSPAVSPTIRTGAPGAQLGATVSPARARDVAITWSTTSNLIKLSATTGNAITVTGSNTTNKADYAIVKATAPNGFYVSIHVFVEPAFTNPPAFTRQPAVGAPIAGKVTLNYVLDLAGKEDQSQITWFQCPDAACTTSRKVAVSRGNLPLKTYPLTAGDIGKYLRATIRPKHNISDPGEEVTATATKPITAADIKTATINPNFRNFVETENPTYETGEWTVLGTWTSSTSEGLINGYGLRVSNPPTPAPNSAALNGRAPNPHSALLYQNDAKVSDMTVRVVMTPEKTAGQGFGIAGSPDDDERNQRADIYFKYDPRTRTGYALRFWRTIQSAEKCMFQLYKIDNGTGTPLDAQQQLTGVFKPNTTITISVTGSHVTVHGSNSTDAETLNLTDTLTPNTFGGAGVYWSGSVPVGNSNVYSEVEITYPNAAKR